MSPVETRSGRSALLIDRRLLSCYLSNDFGHHRLLVTRHCNHHATGDIWIVANERTSLSGIGGAAACSFLHDAAGNRTFLRRRNGLSLMICCKNSKKNGGGRSLRRLAGRALLPTVGHGPNFNLKARFCCRFAAGAAIDEGRLNQLLRRQQPTAPTGWPSIAVTTMVIRSRGRRRIAE